MRTILALAFVGLVAFASPAAAQETWKPTGEVELVVGADAGGAVDRTARLIQKVLQDSNLLGVPITVVNKPGAGQAMAMAYMAQHEGDPNYLVMMSPSIVNSALASGGGKPHEAVTPLIKLFDGDLVLAAGSNTGMNTVEDLAERMKKDVTSVSFAFSTSAGNTSHIALAQLATLTGGDPKKLKIVVNPSGSVTLTQVAGGHVDVGVQSSLSLKPMVDAGKVKMLGVAGAKRLPGLPDLPTFREKGYDVIATSWYAIAGAKGITPEQAKFWQDTFTKVMESEAATQAAVDNNWSMDIIAGDELKSFFDKEWDGQRKSLVELGLISQ